MKIICLDGFKPEYLKYTPYLKSLSKRCLHGELETVYAFTGISASFFTGDYPDKHNIFIMFEFSSRRYALKVSNKVKDYYKNFFRLLQNKKFFNKYYRVPHYALEHLKIALNKMWYQKGVLKQKTIFDYLRENNFSFSYLDFPHCFDGSFSLFLKKSDKAVLGKMQKLKSRVQFIFLHELDRLSHKYGPGSPEVIEHVKFLDKELNKIKDKLIVWSDHGFLEVKGTIDLLSKLKKLNLKYGKDYIYFLGATMAMFRFSNKEAEVKVKKVLKEIGNGRILTEKNLKKLHTPKKQDLLFVPNPGYIIYPDFFDKLPAKGMHGYDPRLKEQKGFYLLKDIKGKRKKGKIIDMLPTLLKILNIELSENIDGKSLI